MLPVVLNCAGARLGRANDGKPMEIPSFIEDLQQRLGNMFAGTPAGDIQRNLKALLNQQFAKLDLVTREEFEIQREVLAKAREKVEALEARVAELELRRG